jgi:hypothetical protein
MNRREFFLDAAKRALDRVDPKDRAEIQRHLSGLDGGRWAGLRPTGDAGRDRLVAARLNLGRT